jgi:hypothetical protein
LKNFSFCHLLLVAVCMALPFKVLAQKQQPVKLVPQAQQQKIDVLINGRLFTSFLYPDTLEKPVLYPIHTANGLPVTRGFPLNPLPGDPVDHPHHIGLWFNYESVNGLDFWNNSYAIPAGRKHLYGWVKHTKILKTASGASGLLVYQSDWTNQQSETIITETTTYRFSGKGSQRVIDRTTTLKAVKQAVFKDVKDGLIALRIAHALQMPDSVRKNKPDSVPTGNYLSSTKKTGNQVWGSRAAWCKVFGKINTDSVSITIFDHPKNINYPAYWHARGYGLFAANPLAEKAFNKNEPARELTLQAGESINFTYRVTIQNGKTTPTFNELNNEATDFNKTR